MKVKILQVSDGQQVEANILIPPPRMVLPSIADGWQFNFKKHSKKSGFQTYILVCEETPDIVEGCLIFEMKDTIEPYMAFIEIAPHNKSESKKYDNVAGCLIAFACRLSFIHGQGDYLGWLAFDVMERDKQDEIKLMALYCKKYGALRFGETTTMVISPKQGEKLIEKFLK